MIEKRKLTFKALFVALSLVFAFSCFATAINGFVKAEEGEWINYEVIYDSDSTTVKGVNLKDSTGGVLSYAIDKATAPTYPSGTVAGFSGAYALITYELGSISLSEYSMLLIKIDRTTGTENASARFFVETEDGNFYRFNTGSARNDVFINEDGSVGTFENNKSVYYKIPANKHGTLCIPMTLPIATGTVVPGSGGTAASASSKMPTDAKIVRFHVGLDTRSSGWYGLTREFGIGSIGALKSSDNTVTRFFDATSLTYTTDASVSTADVNLADMSKGNKVYARHTISGGWVIDEHAEYISKVNAVPTFNRIGYKVVCEHKDVEGKVVASSTTINSTYNSQNATFAYELAGAPEITGYVFKSADKELSGNITQDITVVYTYEEIPAPKMIVSYVDEQGVTIKESEEVRSVFDGSVYNYEVSVPKIFGYDYKEASSELSGTITSDSSIILTYTAQELTSTDKYEVVTTETGAFVGVNLTSSLSGALAMDVVAIDASTGYALLTMNIGEVDPSISTGLLLRVKSLGTASLTQVRIYLEASDGTLYRVTGTPGCSDAVLITPEGAISKVTNSASNARFQFNSLTDGTIFIPWTMASIANSSTFKGIAEGTIFTKLHFGRELRYNSTLNGKVAIGSLAEVNIVGDKVQVKELINTSELTYGITAEDVESQVNLVDKKNGSLIYMTNWATGVNEIGASDVLDTTLALVELSRVPHNVTVKFVNEAGETIKEDEKVEATFTNGSTAYEITPATITGYNFVSADKELIGSTNEDLTVTLTYGRLNLNVTVKYVNEAGETIKDDQVIGVVFNEESNSYSYSVTVAEIWGYIYKEASAELEGEITESFTLTLTYVEDTEVYENYDAIFEEGEFVGVNIKDSMSGAMLINVVGQTSSNNADVYGYSVLTVDIGNVDPSQSSGILIKVKRVDNKNTMAQVRMFLEDSNGVLYRLFSRPADVTGEKTSTVLITPDGEISSVTNDSANHRHLFYGSTNGTIYIPWSDIASVENQLLPEGVVFTKFHFGREGRYGSALDRPVALSHVAIVKVDGIDVSVKMLADLTKMSYTTDANDLTADVNLADMSKGTKVTFNYINGVNVMGSDATIREEQLSVVEIERLPATITLKHVNEEGETIKGDVIAEATYQDGVSVYEIEPSSIVGFEFLSSDKALEGSTMSDITIVLTYKSVDYVITIEYVDENGQVIKESTTVSGKFGEYIEIELEEIEGYTFKESTSGLKFTITGEKTIRVIYTKNQELSSCASSVATGASALMGISLLSIVEIIRKKSKNN